MITKIKISDKDLKELPSKIEPKDISMKDMNFKGLIVNKPWGYEYLMFETPEVSIWMLFIKKGYATSMHCHPQKKTSLLVISGNAISRTLNGEFNLNSKEGLIFDKGVFHSTEAVSEEGIFLMEIETPSNKTDLFRLKDRYNRENKGYSDKKNITNKTYNYHYLFLDSFKDFTNNFGKDKFMVRRFNTTDSFNKEKEVINADLAIILSGELKIEGEIFNAADIIPFEKLENCEIVKSIKFLFIKKRKNLIKLSDYVISFLEKNNLNSAFLVSGGNLMHLLESIRINKNFNYLCNHHEQASAMAAEGYAKMTNEPGVAFVTSGPGGTNAITGVAGAWMDSNPLIMISGQSYSTQTIGKTKLRQLGVQEINIVDMVRPITKYAIMVKDPKKIKYYLQKALYLATHHRPGPAWIDIPINMQMALIEEDELTDFKPPLEEKSKDSLEKQIEETINLIKNAERPVILLGNGVRLGKAEEIFVKVASKLNIPILTSRNANDLLSEDNPLYIGRPGSFGQRHANYAIQNSDLLISLGSRIALALTGWAYNDFARHAKKVVVDVDKSELEKPIIRPDVPINCDIKLFLEEFYKKLENFVPNDLSSWKKRIEQWKEKYPVVYSKDREDKNSINPYYFLENLSKVMSDDEVITTDMGMSFQCTMQALKITKNQRLFTSSGLAAMGYGLPGAIGACIGNKRKRVICITGDGGLQMNIQELQTILHNKLPIKIFIFNNNGYTSIRETQRNYFEGYLASDENSGVSFPDMVKLGTAYGIKSKRIERPDNLEKEISEVLNSEGPYICDIVIPEDKDVHPKQGSFNRPDGKTVPRPIEDMIPYVSNNELKEDMIIEEIPFDPYKE